MSCGLVDCTHFLGGDQCLIDAFQAVIVGGGVPHRMTLSDMTMLKAGIEVPDSGPQTVRLTAVSCSICFSNSALLRGHSRITIAGRAVVISRPNGPTCASATFILLVNAAVLL